jgi:hypothetical protein
MVAKSKSKWMEINSTMQDVKTANIQEWRGDI